MFEEKIVVGRGGEYPLNGILTIPGSTGGPVPAVVLVHGSGSTNMDEKISANTPFRDIAEGLAERGIAAIRYDKRSFVYGHKLVKNPSFTVREETIEDAILAADMLRNDDRIDSDRIFIAGHSMGGMLAPRIDAEGGNFAGLIIMAGTPRLLETVLFEQLDELAATYKGPLGFIIRKQKKGLENKLAHIYDIDDEKAKTIKVAGGATVWYFKEMGLKDSPAYLAQTRKPILVMHGAKDAQVRTDLDFYKYRELLAGRDNVTFKLYPELNHLFITSAYGELKQLNKEYRIKGKVDARALDDIAEFIRSV